ncbi:MAG: hypothetical protein H6697_01320 [Myxococcales bacterium]|nr:hypothetical protein [Myxococcales bacterium]
MTRIGILATITATLTALAACSDSSPPSGDRRDAGICRSADDCVDGEECVAFVCVAADVEDEEIRTIEDTQRDAPDTDVDTGEEPDGADGGPDADTGIEAGGFGAGCREDRDCDSGYCIDTREGRVCTVPCTDTCPAEGWSCRRVSDGGVDLVMICVPDETIVCEPCEADIECGGLDDLCLDYPDGRFCGQVCDAGSDCPTGYVCDEVSTGGGGLARQCVREFGICGDCLDFDGDLYGEGPGCLGLDCDEASDATFDGAPELCDRADNDCDAEVDEGFDFEGDPANCGGCGVACRPPRGVGACEAGACVVASCAEGRYDVNGDYEDGCEYACTPNAASAGAELCNSVDDDCDGDVDEGFDLSADTSNCGRCGLACNLANASSLCMEGACVVDDCAGSFADCNGLDVDGCEVDTLSDRFNCGDCTQFCELSNAASICTAGECAISRCTAGWDDCDLDPANGCEVSLNTDEENCGECGYTCDISGGLAVCVDGSCAVGLCGEGLADCDFDRETGCEVDLRTDPNNCGACGNPCVAAHATTSCAARRCSIARCDTGYYDVNGVFEDGCEYACTPSGAEVCDTIDNDCDGAVDETFDLEGDVNNCGGCGHVCIVPHADASCVDGDCEVRRCELGFEDCNRAATDGCEVALQFDPLNCGACGAVCDVPNASASCIAGACRVSSCVAPWADCDLNPANGCEANLDSDELNCGRCLSLCAFSTGTGLCDEGTCVVGGCGGGLADCDGSTTNGCEVDIASSASNCGGCGVVCDVPNATERCSARTCSIQTCDPGYRDCDTLYATGCEANINNDVANCGSCGRLCDIAHARSTCIGGGCLLDTCLEPWANCDLAQGNGCEANLLTSTTNCGTCGRACSFANAAPICDSGSCRIGSCVGDYANCNGADVDGCEVDTATNPNHCGRCGRRCSLPNATAACTDGGCTIASCAGGWADCDGLAENGCEANINTSLANCGRCGAVCALDNASEVCRSGVCEIDECAFGFGDCDLADANGCESNLRSTDRHCGLCDFNCALEVGPTTRCVDYTCQLRTCLGTTADCDGSVGNGCETDTATSLTNCGACGTTCSVPNATEICTAGACAISDCASGFADCDGLYANGCEVNFNNDPNNCGTCRNVCSFPSANEVCLAGTCAIGSCQGNTANCDGVIGNGCEVSVTTDVLNCGGCGVQCSIPNAVPACRGGTCGIASCLPGWADCDLILANGCETAIGSDPANCGGCGSRCVVSGGVAECRGGFCAVGECADDYGDCDGNPLNGCESDLRTNRNHCGACGAPCTPANAVGACEGGSCRIQSCLGAFRDCDLDVATGCEADTQNSLGACGGCGQVCDFAGATETCSGGVCRFDRCISGYYDANGNTADGCEYACTPTSDVDVPDAAGLDQNCDGIDGDRSRSVFVWVGGSSSNSGLTPESPVPTLARALTIAAASSDRDTILVAQGTYVTSTIEVRTGGVWIYGGYDRTFRTRSSVRPVISTTDDVALRVVGVTSPVHIEQIDITVENAVVPGAGRFALVVDASGDNVSVRSSTLSAGTGGAGATGRAGRGGQDGGDGLDASGSSPGGPGYPGGGLGGQGQRQAAGTSGAPGQAIGAACGGAGGAGDGANLGCLDGDPRTGGDGSDGCSGVSGTHGSGGGPLGTLDGTSWTAANGTAGTGGTSGGGGGGGGAGGGEDCNFLGICIFCGTGRGGGGGGGGGTGGAAGAGGGGGGASVALLVRASTVTLDSVLLRALGGSAGGAGGEFGRGGSGGAPGSGAPSGSNTDGPGGDGGQGGDGGSGGCGGGGGGGPSFGAWGAGGASLRRAGTVGFAVAPGGTGGDSCANAGASGSQGSTLAITEL